MKTFKVYRHPTKGFEAVKIGFSWPAFFFGGFWIAAKRLWGLTFIWWVLMSFLNTTVKVMSDNPHEPAPLWFICSLMLVTLALWLIPAFKGNSWISRKLERRGYEILKVVSAASPEEAIVMAKTETTTEK